MTVNLTVSSFAYLRGNELPVVVGHAELNVFDGQTNKVAQWMSNGIVNAHHRAQVVIDIFGILTS